MQIRQAVEFQPRDGLPNSLARLQSAGSARIAYFGGSITAAAGWRVKSLAWIRSRFPQVDIGEINAAIGGTGSDLGAFRYGLDVLRHKPDLVFVEFAVNDAAAARERIHRCMEGIVRQSWDADPAIDLCFVYTAKLEMLDDLLAGRCPPSVSAMEEVAEHYGIPSINLALEVASRVRAGGMVFKAAKPATPAPGTAVEAPAAARTGPVVFSEDGVHPLAAGHEVYAEVVARSLARLASTGPRAHALARPLSPGNLANATMLPPSAVRLDGRWSRLDPATDPVAKHFAPRMPDLYMASEPGASLRFEFAGTAVGVYDLLGPDCGQVVVSIDGGEERTLTRFDGYCTYRRIGFLRLADDLPDARHRVEIRLDSLRPDKRSILFPHNRPDFDADPSKYGEAKWYVGGILLAGQIGVRGPGTLSQE